MCPSDRSLPALSIDSRKSVSLFYSSFLSPLLLLFLPSFFLSSLFRCELSVSFFAVYSDGLLRSSLLNRINSMLFSVFFPSSFIFLRFLIEKRSRFYIRCSNFETKRVINYEYERRTSGKARFAAKHTLTKRNFET